MATVMSSLMNNKEAAVQKVKEVWAATEPAHDSRQLQNEIRKEVEERVYGPLRAAVEAEIKEKFDAALLAERKERARAIVCALGQGASKASLRKVTPSDHWGFEAYVDLGQKLAWEQQ